MRLSLALLATIACAQTAAAQTVEDRYGPPRTVARAEADTGSAQRVATLSPYAGRMLNWSGKLAPQTPPTPEAGFEPQPVPQAAPQPVAPTPVAATPAPRPVVAPPARPVAVQAHAAPLPDSLYAAPPPAAPAPQRMAAAATRPATPASTGSNSRLYSVHREYGLSPDAIPAARNGASPYVLIGLPEAAAGGTGARESNTRDDDDRPF